IAGETLEGPLPPANVQEVVEEHLQARLIERRVGVLDVHDAVGLRHRQATVGDAIDDAEHRGGQADAETESDNRQEGMAGMAEEQAQAEADVLTERSHEGSSRVSLRWRGEEGYGGFIAALVILARPDWRGWLPYFAAAGFSASSRPRQVSSLSSKIGSGGMRPRAALTCQPQSRAHLR